MQAVAYLRVSTDEQADSRAGLEAQADSCRRYALGLGAELIGPFADEGVGGASGLDKRPGLLQAIGELTRGDVLLVAKRDRLGRDPIVVAMIEAAVKRKDARIVSAAGEGTEGDDPTNVLMRRIVDAFAEYERLIIAARTRAALQAKIRRGHRCGKVRFGYDLADDGKTLVPNLVEQAVLALIHRLRQDGHSLREIAAELTARGLPTKEGHTQWTHSTIRGILGRAA